jgi:hybrid cluster-associated redox disulfide protein
MLVLSRQLKCRRWLRMADKITKDTGFSEVLEKYPKTATVMLKHGLHCIGCHAASFETIEQGCIAHGMKDEDIKKLLKEMNDVVKD